MRLKWISDITLYHSGFSPDMEHDSDGEHPPYPPVDVVITDNELHIWVDLPGVQNEDISLYIQGGLLVIEGVKQSHYPQGQRRIFHRVERQHTPFRRTLRLHSPVNENAIFSKLDNGVLHIVIKT